MYTTTAKYLDGKFRFELKAGAHTQFCDVTAAEGGEDSAPSPHDYLSMALASCTTMTIRMYAVRKGWPLENAVVTVDVDKSIVGTVFKRSIVLQGNLDDEQKKRIMEIADKCPIHKILVGKIEVESVLL